MGMTTAPQTEKIFRALDALHIELPSWGFANTGTRFGKFLQHAAATSTEEKFSDAGEVHKLTGVCPTVALHVLWDLPEGAASTGAARRQTANVRIARSRNLGVRREFKVNRMEQLPSSDHHLDDKKREWL